MAKSGFVHGQESGVVALPTWFCCLFLEAESSKTALANFYAALSSDKCSEAIASRNCVKRRLSPGETVALPATIFRRTAASKQPALS
ncbi:MAG: hypothetical protein E5V59_18080 [Mesorhizobium sp.]|nr:MAG: hypothetical protein E5V59_18080 [Mesorhizobium sp.]